MLRRINSGTLRAYFVHGDGIVLLGRANIYNILLKNAHNEECEDFAVMLLSKFR